MFVKKTYKRNRTFLNESSQSQLTQSKNSRKQNEKDNTHDQEESIYNSSELPVPDVIDYNLNVLFVGLFSGKKSIKERHHYSSSNNHFYYALYESGMTNGDRLTYQDDQCLPRDYKIGIVTLVSRPEHRSKTKLSVEEIRKGFPNLLEKVEKYRPKILCFNGKALFQAFASFQNTRIRSSTKGKKIVTEGWGEQPNFSIQWNDHTGCTKVFCVISTSGRVAQYKKQRKVKHFEKLKELIYNDEDEDSNKKCIEIEEHVMDVKMKEENIDLANAYFKETLNNEQVDYKDNNSSLNKKRKREQEDIQEDIQDYSPPRSFMAKRWWLSEEKR